MPIAPQTSIDTFAQNLSPGPVAIIRDEDGVGLQAAIDHATTLGFGNVIVIANAPSATTNCIQLTVPANVETHELLNQMLDSLAGRWVYFGYNAEFLYFPFCEGRQISDAAQFIDEERRDAVYCVTVDLYPSELDRSALSLPRENAHFDIDGYFSRNRWDGPNQLDRQIEVFGGLKRRYSEHIDWNRQRIDRVGFFKAKTGLRMTETGHFNDEEMNTISCPWHHNMTFCVASFRVAKSLINNPGSAYGIDSFMWEGSASFDWTSQSLMERGLMEPGQWF